MHTDQIEEQVDLDTYPLQPEALRSIPKSVAIKYDLIPLSLENDTLLVAMADVNNTRVIQEMAAVCKKTIVPLQADPAQIYRAIDVNYNYNPVIQVEKPISKAAPLKAETASATNKVKDQIDLNTYPLQPEALHAIPMSVAVKYNIMPLVLKKDTLTVAMADVYNIQTIQEVAAVCQKRIVPLTANPAQIHSAIEYNYKLYGEAEEQPGTAAPQEIEILNVSDQAEEQVDPNIYLLQPEALQLIPESMAAKYDLIPLSLENDTLIVAMADVNNMQAIQETTDVSKKRIVPLLADLEQIRQAIDLNYKSYDNIEKLKSEAATEEIEMIRVVDKVEEQVDLNTYPLQPEAFRAITKTMATKYNLMPLSLEKDTLTVAMADVNNMQAIQEMADVSKKRIVPLPADPDQIRQAIDYNYKLFAETDKQSGKAAPKETKLLSTSVAVRYVDLNTYPLQPEALQLIPASVAVRYNVMPLAVKKDTLTVAMADENNMQAIQEMATISKKRIIPLPADPDQIRQAVNFNYKSYSEVEKHLGKVTPKKTEADEKATVDVADAPIVKALDIIMSEAIKARTSDIHIEPQEDMIRVRYRIDGVLQDTMSLPLSAQSALISRIKVMGRMNIADHRPQDGQLSFKVKDQEIDMRVATINTIYGEMCTMRILDKSFAVRSLPELGFSTNTLDQFQEVLKAPMGTILVCGPTGSGKTTTLYASINSLDRKGRKVITVEDPVEYRFEKINQIQVNPKADITFSSAVRSFMRHDPDILLIGEIRDPDTASMAMQASLIGQLVLSSIHAKDTAGSITRLLDLGIGPFLISATLVCVLSQRMARKVCPHCRELTTIPPEALAAYFDETGVEQTEFYVGRGCNTCGQTGYLGRTAISEIMVVNHDIRSAIMNNASADEIRDIAKNSGMISMWHDGMLQAQAGITTPSEVLRNILFTG